MDQNADEGATVAKNTRTPGDLFDCSQWTSNNVNLPELKSQMEQLVARAEATAHALKGFDDLKRELLTNANNLDHLSRSMGNSQSMQKALSAAQALSKQTLEAQANLLVRDFVNIITPLKLFTEAVHSGDERAFENCARNLENFTKTACDTANVICGNNPQSNQLLTLTPQLTNGGRIRMTYGDPAEEHFKNLETQYQESLQNLRALCDEHVPANLFVQVTKRAMEREQGNCNRAFAQKDTLGLVNGTSALARQANRVLMITNAERDNSEDPLFTYV